MIKNTNKRKSTSQGKTIDRSNYDDEEAFEEGKFQRIHITNMRDADGDIIIIGDRGRKAWEKIVDKIPDIKKGHVSKYNEKVIARFYPPGHDARFTLDENGFASLEERDKRRAVLLAATMGEYFEFLEKTEQRLMVYFFDTVNNEEYLDLNGRTHLEITIDKVNEVTGLKLKNSIQAYQFLWNLSRKYFCLRRQRDQRRWFELLYDRTNDPDKLISDTFCMAIEGWYECDFYEIVEYINNKRAFNSGLGKVWP